MNSTNDIPPAARAAVLSEALPFLRQYRGQTMVIKYGGNAMIDERLKAAVVRDIVLLHFVGFRPIVVHGGGPEITDAMKRMGKTPEFVGGQRVTDAETVEIVEMVLAGKTNKGIVSLINRAGGKAVGLSGKDGNLIAAKKRTSPDGVDLGFVGDVTGINPEILNVLTQNDYIPIISSVAVGPEGETLNINADLVAGDIAAALDACKFILMTDVEGVYRDFSDKSSLLTTLKLSEARRMIAEGEVDKGMIPKLESCARALEGGVERAHIIDGRQPNALLIELFTQAGIGTMLERDG
ncbi:MAG: acetylglutamate kinase [Armatimonadetes bacterium]|nr:acetylglutamate kinase [Armatimonadota bacterium]